eukprot:XP_001709566.1 Hypothetical protein GL50803_5862 [Giardia lamblia ATCC 50803]
MGAIILQLANSYGGVHAAPILRCEPTGICLAVITAVAEGAATDPTDALPTR